MRSAQLNAHKAPRLTICDCYMLMTSIRFSALRLLSSIPLLLNFLSLKIHDHPGQPPDFPQISLLLAKLPLRYKITITWSFFSPCFHSATWGEEGSAACNPNSRQNYSGKILVPPLHTLLFNLSRENYSSLKRCVSHKNTI